VASLLFPGIRAAGFPFRRLTGAPRSQAAARLRTVISCGAMHRGVQALLSWIGEHPSFPGVKLAGPADLAALTEVEDQVLSPLPTDLRMLLVQHNGGQLPTGILLRAGGSGPDSIIGELRRLAPLFGMAPEDPELPLPYFRSHEGAVLAFDRGAAPVADTWPVVDCAADEGLELRLVHRTFDGWCRLCLREWTAPDYGQQFSLSRYLNGGLRHVEVEPDVATAHATVAHALRRSGEPERALGSYLLAARCVPQLAFCDWEGLKLAVLLRDVDSALTIARRLCSRAPARAWQARATTPRQVADVLGLLVAEVDPPEPLLALLDLLGGQAPDEESRQAIAALRRAVFGGAAVPAPRPLRPTAVQPLPQLEAFWSATEHAYRQGAVRDEDLLLDPAYRPLARIRPLVDLLRIRRDFQ